MIGVTVNLVEKELKQHCLSLKIYNSNRNKQVKSVNLKTALLKLLSICGTNII